MSEEKYFEQVIAIIKDGLAMDNDAEITKSMSLKGDLGADSLDVVLIVSKLEEEFDITIEENIIADIRTVGDIVNKLAELKD